MRYAVIGNNNGQTKMIAQFDLLNAAQYFIATYLINNCYYPQYDSFDITYKSNDNIRVMETIKREGMALKKLLEA